MTDGWEIRVQEVSVDPADPPVWDAYLVNLPDPQSASDAVRKLTGASVVEPVAPVPEDLLRNFLPGETRRLAAEF